MALAASATPFEIREVVLRSKPAEMIAASAKATVPVLVLADGGVIDESLDIMRWALRRNDPENWLAGDDHPLILRFDDRFKHHLDRYKYADRHQSDPNTHRALALALVEELEERLTLHDHLCRPERGLTDIAIMPFVRQFAAVDRAWFASQALPRVHAWLTLLVASPLFEQAMERLPPWRAGDAPTIWSTR